jgi:hypothetical protein
MPSGEPQNGYQHLSCIRIDNSIIDELASKIGIWARNLRCDQTSLKPKDWGLSSYKTIARKLGIDRGAVIRYVKNQGLNPLDPSCDLKKMATHSNQYNFDKGSGINNQSVPSRHPP